MAAGLFMSENGPKQTGNNSFHFVFFPFLSSVPCVCVRGSCERCGVCVGDSGAGPVIQKKSENA